MSINLSKNAKTVQVESPVSGNETEPSTLVEKPSVISISGQDTEHVPETPTIVSSLFSTHDGHDSHKATDWVIESLSADVAPATIVYQSLDDTKNKTSITIPQGYLKEGSAYTIRLRYRGNSYGKSEWGHANFSTEQQFTTSATDLGAKTKTLFSSAFEKIKASAKEKAPTVLDAASEKFKQLTTSSTALGTEAQTRLSSAFEKIKASAKEKAPTVLDAASEKIKQLKTTSTALGAEAQTLLGSAFKTVTASAKEGIQKAASDQVVNAASKTAKKVACNVINLASSKLIEDPVQANSTCQTVCQYFSLIAKPNIFVEQDELGVYEDPLITASAFENESGLDGDEHKATDWVILNTADGSEVWSSYGDEENLYSIRVAKDKLRTNTAYRVRVRYQAAVSGWGPWSEVDVTTQETFFDTNLPTLQHANIVKEGQQLRFDFATEQLYVRQGKVKPNYLRVKLNNNTTAELVDAFTIEVNPNGNYSVLRTKSYNLNEEDDFDFQVFYKNDNDNNDFFPCSAISTRPATLSDEPFIYLEKITKKQFCVLQCPTIEFSLRGAQSLSHLKTDWEIRDITDATTLWSSMADTQHLTQIRCEVMLDKQHFYLLHIRAYVSRNTKQNTQVIEFTTKIFIRSDKMAK